MKFPIEKKEQIMNADTRGIRELVKDKFACCQCHGSRQVITIGGIKAECKACRGFGTWGIKLEEIVAFAESIVEQCCKDVCVRCRAGEGVYLHPDGKIRHVNSGSVCDAEPIRSRWQRGEK